MTLLKKILLFGGAVIVLVAVTGLLFIWKVVTRPVGEPQHTKNIVIAEGSGIRDIAPYLEKEGVIDNQIVFLGYVWFKGSYRNIRAGEYSVPGYSTMIDVVNLFLVGEGDSRELSARFIEGWTSRQMAGYLREQGVPAWSSFLTAAQLNDSKKILPDRNFDFLADKPAQASLEGYLFPDTYRIFRDAEAKDILDKMLTNFGQKLTPEIRREIERQGRTVFEVVTLASIVEKEGRSVEDRRKIAHVFIKRLQIEMPLQSDATVNFVTGKDSLQPTFEDLETPSSYNTYLNKGLPPGPISNPSLESIKAVVFPEENDYYYFLTKPDGQAVFSVTGEEHLQNKQKYLQ